jgi:hypothetical protein
MEKLTVEQCNEIIDDISMYMFGNNILYTMCDNKQNEWENEYRLADKIWMIGRSYAASPERRYTWKKGVSDKDKKTAYQGDGRGKFFREVAKNLVNNKDYQQILQTMKELNGFAFDKSAEDMQKLKVVVELVRDFNQVLNKAIVDFDCEHNKKLFKKMNHKNLISFCSKFLHFHCPQNIFILDNYTLKGGKKLYPNRIISKDYKDIKFNLDKNDIDNEAVKEYKQHCIREYICCYELREKYHVDFKGLYATRAADAISQNVLKYEPEDKNGK